MSDPHALHTATLIQQTAPLPKLTGLLERSVGADDLLDYGTLARGILTLQMFGNLRDSLDCVGNDSATRVEYATAMYAAALTEIGVAQQDRIETLEGSQAKPAKATKTTAKG
jgi:hypothetical protein